MSTRSIAIAAVALLVAGCGTGRDLALIIETEGDARASDVRLRIDDEVRLYGDVRDGRRIRERDVMDGTLVELHAANGGGGGAVIVRALVDGCELDRARCEGAGCTARLRIEVREACD